MAIEAKVSFLNQLENKLRTTTTAEMMTKYTALREVIVSGSVREDYRRTAMVDKTET